MNTVSENISELFARLDRTYTKINDLSKLPITDEYKDYFAFYTISAFSFKTGIKTVQIPMILKRRLSSCFLIKILQTKIFLFLPI